MIDSTFVEAIAELRNHVPQVLKVHGREELAMPDGKGNWSLAGLDKPEILAASVILGTLEGFVGYVKDNRDGLDLGKHIAHVVSPSRVELLGPVGPAPFHQRPVPAVADLSRFTAGADGSGFAFGQWKDVESFVIGLQAHFVQTPERDAVLKLVGSTKDEAVRQTDDDGVTQSVVARQGAVLVEEVKVPNPVLLRPFRTFREVEQPEGRFILRLRSGGPVLALFVADGEGWRLEAVAKIKEFLEAQFDLAGVHLAVVA